MATPPLSKTHIQRQSQREEILGMKLFAPQVQRMARFLEDSERDFLVRKFLAERGDEDTGDG